MTLPRVFAPCARLKNTRKILVVSTISKKPQSRSAVNWSFIEKIIQVKNEPTKMSYWIFCPLIFSRNHDINVNRLGLTTENISETHCYKSKKSSSHSILSGFPSLWNVIFSWGWFLSFMRLLSSLYACWWSNAILSWQLKLINVCHIFLSEIGKKAADKWTWIWIFIKLDV